MPASDHVSILLADDDPDDRLLAAEALEESHIPSPRLTTVEDGEELLEYLRGIGRYAGVDNPRPDLILLDLNMPRMDGREALELMKADPHLRRIPVVVMSTSKSGDDIGAAYDLGVNSFISKPLTFDGLVSIMSDLSRYWLHVVELPSGSA